jgi:hypothetical protein
MEHIFERAGVHLRMDYEPAEDHNGPNVIALRVLDVNLKPVGPNLVPLFAHLLVVHAHSARGLEVESVISDLVGELDGNQSLVH